ncbi:hypothetical protein [Streptomyces zhihengii]
MPLLRGELARVRPLKVGQDAHAGIAQCTNIAAATDVDEAVLAWQTHDVATTRELTIVGPEPCLNTVLTTRDGHVPHQFPYTEQLLNSSPRAGHRAPPPGASPLPLRRTGTADPGRRELPPALIELDHPEPMGFEVTLTEENGHRVSLTEATAPEPASKGRTSRAPQSR